mgnify:CR=1 FL=1
MAFKLTEMLKTETSDDRSDSRSTHTGVTIKELLLIDPWIRNLTLWLLKEYLSESVCLYMFVLLILLSIFFYNYSLVTVGILIL